MSATARDVPTVTLRKEEAARALGVSLAWFERNVDGKVPRIQIGRMCLYRVKDLEKWAESNLEWR